MKKSNNILVSNAGIKLISLGLAVLLEFYFYSQDNSTTQLVSAVLEFQNVPSNRMIIDPPNAEDGIPAQLEVNGPKSVVRQIAQGFHPVKVIFPDKPPYSFPIDITYESLQLPPSVKILSAKPARLTIRTVELLKKEIPVEVPTEGILPEGYELRSVKIFPKTVIARGPLQEIQKLDSIKLEPLNITGLGEPAKFELKVKNPGDMTSLNVNLVSVDIEIREKESVKEISLVPVTQDSGILGIGKKVLFNPGTVKVVLKGTQKAIEKSSGQLKVVVDGSFDKLPKKLPLKVVNTEDVQIEKIIPSEVVVRNSN